MSDRRPFDVRLYDDVTPRERPTGYLCLLSDQSEVGNILNRIRIDEWLTNLGPSRELRQWCKASDSWYDFERRYRLELEEKQVECDRLAGAARHQILWLVAGLCGFMQRGIAALKWHLENCEAKRRYRTGWINGGYATPVCTEIHRLGRLCHCRPYRMGSDLCRPTSKINSHRIANSEPQSAKHPLFNVLPVLTQSGVTCRAIKLSTTLPKPLAIRR